MPRRKGPPACRQAGTEPLALSASGRERMVYGRAAASEEERMDLPEEIAWFGNMLNVGDILNMDGPLVEIGSRPVFANSVVGGWQLPAGEESAHDLTPPVRRERKNCGQWPVDAKQRNSRG